MLEAGQAWVPDLFPMQSARQLAAEVTVGEKSKVFNIHLATAESDDNVNGLPVLGVVIHLF